MAVPSDSVRADFIRHFPDHSRDLVAVPPLANLNAHSSEQRDLVLSSKRSSRKMDRKMKKDRHCAVDPAASIREIVRVIPEDPPMTIARAHLISDRQVRYGAGGRPFATACQPPPRAR